MLRRIDYNEYDSISLALKENESERMISYYRAFGWEVYERREDKRYFDIVHVKLKRAHKIVAKDRLQLLQVKMEYLVNSFAAARKNKHSRSLIAALTLGVFAAGFIALGVCLLAAGMLLALSISLLAFGLVSPLFIVPLVKRIFKLENKIYAVKFKEMTAGVSRIIREAEKLLGGENEKRE